MQLSATRQLSKTKARRFFTARLRNGAKGLAKPITGTEKHGSATYSGMNLCPNLPRQSLHFARIGSARWTRVDPKTVVWLPVGMTATPHNRGGPIAKCPPIQLLRKAMTKKKAPKKKQVRIDQLLVSRQLATDTDQATRLLMSGQVLVNDTPITKAGDKVAIDAAVRLRGKNHDYVGRGGLKLEAALDHWRLDLSQVVALDLGSSTGGFTDCMLRRGAQRVYAVDVGSNQLDFRLRRDPRVVVLEQTHAKTLNATLVPDPITFLSADVSFTSLKYVLPFVFPLTAPDARCLLLFKPQFELSRAKVGPGGIVTDTAAVSQACTDMAAWLETHNHDVLGQIKSPVKGREGNQEFWFYTRQKR